MSKTKIDTEEHTWHSALQYFTILHAEHDFRPSPHLPQLAQLGLSSEDIPNCI